MKKVLFVATVLKTHINAFHKPYLKLFSDNGYQVYVAAKNDYHTPKEADLTDIDNYVDIAFSRSPFSVSNIKAYQKLKQLINDNNFDIIHCHTPVAAVLCRLAARKARKAGTRVFYTAHGFHFFKGAAFKNWLIYYPVERFLSLFTDVLITLNQEDYQRALAFTLNADLKIYKVNGVGVSLDKFRLLPPAERQDLRIKKGYQEKEFIIIYVAELINRKNQEFLIESVPNLKEIISNLKVLLVGSGINYDAYDKLIKQNELQDSVKLLGFRTDINELLNIADIAVSCSKHEGLPLNVLEAMAVGLPFLVSDCRGNRDLADDSINGQVYYNKIDFIKKIVDFYQHKENKEREVTSIIKYSLPVILNEMATIYGLEVPAMEEEK